MKDESFTTLMRWLLETAPQGEPGTPADFRSWWSETAGVGRHWPLPFDGAVAAGFRAPGVGFAFGAGYEAGLRRLVPGLDAGAIVSLSVTEEGGGHPRAIAARLEPRGGDRWALSGDKKWATLSPLADLLLVAASEGDDLGGRKRIRLVRVARGVPGVEVEAMPPTEFTPEITHGVLRLRDVAIAAEQILPGDGFAEYVKPFRTIEDVHVAAGLLGYQLAVATRYAWPHAAREELLDLIVNLRALALGDPSSPHVHVALAGFLSIQRRVLDALEPHWSLAPEDVRQRWERDRRLTAIAGSARARRREVAWERI